MVETLNSNIRLPTNNKNKVIILFPISSHTFGDIDMKPSRGDMPRSNLGGEGCDQLPTVTSCQFPQASAGTSAPEGAFSAINFSYNLKLNFICIFHCHLKRPCVTFSFTSSRFLKNIDYCKIIGRFNCLLANSVLSAPLHQPNSHPNTRPT